MQTWKNVAKSTNPFSHNVILRKTTKKKFKSTTMPAKQTTVVTCSPAKGKKRTVDV